MITGIRLCYVHTEILYINKGNKSIKVWRLSRFIGGGRPQVPLHAL